MSKAYEDFVKLLKSSDPKKEDLYSTDILSEIYDSETEKVEDLIWETFYKKQDTGLLIFFPKLKKYDGIGALKKLLYDYAIPSELNMLVSYLIYQSTGEAHYLELMEKNIVESQYNYSYIAMMIYSEPCEAVYQALVRIYMNCSERVAITSCVDGILYNKGFISDLADYNQLATTNEIANILRKAPFNERKMLIEKLEKGDFDQYKCMELSRDIKD